MIGNMRKRLFVAFVLVGICSFPHVVQAEDYSYLTSNPPMIYGMPELDKKGNTTIEWSSVIDESMDESAMIAYEIQVAKNTAFTDAKQYSTKEATLTLNKSEFGKNGGKFYARVRLVVDYVDVAQTDLYSDWSKEVEMAFVKINKTNFPGMYKVLKNGGKSYDFLKGKVEKVIYDTNGDGWIL